MGFGPVPYTAILQYAAWNGVTDADDFACFLASIRAMDQVWLEFANKEDSKPKVSNREMSPELYDAHF